MAMHAPDDWLPTPRSGLVSTTAQWGCAVSESLVKLQSLPCWAFTNQPTPFFGVSRSTSGQSLFSSGEVGTPKELEGHAKKGGPQHLKEQQKDARSPEIFMDIRLDRQQESL
jgi:hypothetical protein